MQPRPPTVPAAFPTLPPGTIEALPWLALVAWGPPLLLAAPIFAGPLRPLVFAGWTLLTVATALVGRRHPRAGRVASLALVLAAAVVATVWGDTSVLAAPPVALAVLAFLPLVLVAVAWGVQPAAILAAVAAAVTLVHRDGPATAVATHLLAVACLTGWVLRRSLLQAGRLNRILADVALVDATTGLGNLRSLRRDFVRYKALAQRGGRPLLLSRWLPPLPPGAAWEDPGLLTEFVHALEETTRQSDALYSLGHFEFVGLHVDLTSADGPARRLQALHPGTRVTWAVVDEASPLEALLDEVRRDGTAQGADDPVPALN